MKLSKKGFILSVLFIALAVIIAIGGTVAYFTAVDEVTNTFTMGKIKISFDEPNWDDETDGKKLLPGDVRVKDPIVTAVEGKSYMRIRMEIRDGEGALITDMYRLELILKTLFYDTSYDSTTLTQNLIQGEFFSISELNTLADQGEINKEYNRSAFAFSGIEVNKPAVRYYNYIANGGIFDAKKEERDTAVLFSNVVIPKDWNNEELFILSGDEYEVDSNGGLEVTIKGTGYKIVMIAEAIQESEMASATDAFAALDEAIGVIRDTSGI